MSILENILGGIFGRAQGQTSSSAPRSTPVSGTSGPQSGQPTSGHPGNIPYAPQATPQPRVDVETLLDQLAKNRKEKLDWKHSIVDMMKLLDLDSSLAARKELAKELDYSGDTNDSAAMNIWLHKQVMTKLAENGGKVPDSLKH